MAAPAQAKVGEKTLITGSGQVAPKKVLDMTPVKKADLPIIVVIGGPGSGKGTQCDKIKEKYNFFHLSTGDLLRQDAKAGTPRGKQLTAIMAKGELVPLVKTRKNAQDLHFVLIPINRTLQDIVIDLLKEAMLKAVIDSKNRGFLIDGFPRDIHQADELTKQIGLPKAAIYFECTDEILVKRLIDRGKLSGRVDDNEHSIKTRLDVFHKQTVAVTEFYKAKNLLHAICARREVDQIFADVAKLMDGILMKKPSPQGKPTSGS